MPLPKLEDWNAPWETETGENDIDKPKLKKYLHNLLGDKERLQETVTTVTAERDTLKNEADAASRQGETEVDRLKREKQELEDKLAQPPAESPEVLKLRVALKKGLTETQAKRLIGNSEEELEADADALVESFGANGKSGEEGEPPRRTPRRVSNAGDPKPEEGKEVSVEDALSQIPRL